MVRGCFGWAQDIPTAFWRTHGIEEFDGVCYTLNGPLLPWTVKTAARTFGKQTVCSFTKGWTAFCTANDLKLGDTLKFTWTGPVDFEVRKV